MFKDSSSTLDHENSGKSKKRITAMLSQKIDDSIDGSTSSNNGTLGSGFHPSSSSLDHHYQDNVELASVREPALRLTVAQEQQLLLAISETTSWVDRLIQQHSTTTESYGTFPVDSTYVTSSAGEAATSNGIEELPIEEKLLFASKKMVLLEEQLRERTATIERLKKQVKELSSTTRTSTSSLTLQVSSDSERNVQQTSSVNKKKSNKYNMNSCVAGEDEGVWCIGHKDNQHLQ